MSQADDLTYTDADLVALLRAGDEEAISQLVEQWSPTMLRVARSFVDSAQSAEDVVQEAWLGMLSGLARFEGRSSLRTWTFTILVNRARTRGAREARTVPQSALAGGDEPAAEGWSSIDVASRWDTAPETVVLSREALLELDRAISALPPRQRQVVTMREIGGMSAGEICAVLAISPANQRVLLHRARAALRAALTGYYRG
ncbi:MAG TPA: RNA polymerase sigma factor [Streptosporangiaceae bacterium]|nr:RNA polymerase sigma factor [Streptosporangiaceae bacterium]